MPPVRSDPIPTTRSGRVIRKPIVYEPNEVCTDDFKDDDYDSDDDSDCDSELSLSGSEEPEEPDLEYKEGDESSDDYDEESASDDCDED